MGRNNRRIRLTKKLLAHVPKALKETYIYWRNCMSEDYRKYGSPGIEVDAEYRAARAKVIEYLINKNLI